MDAQSEVFDEQFFNILVKFQKIQFMLKKFKIRTIFRIPFKMESLISLAKDLLNRFQKNGVVYKMIFTLKVIRGKGNLWCTIPNVPEYSRALRLNLRNFPHHCPSRKNCMVRHKKFHFKKSGNILYKFKNEFSKVQWVTSCDHRYLFIYL